MFYRIAKKIKIAEFLSILFLAVFLYLGIHYAEMIDGKILSAINAHNIEGTIFYIIFISIMVLAIPISTIPFVPFAIKGLGVFIGGFATLLAWEISSYIAFNLARKHRTFFKKHVSLVRKTEKQLKKFLKHYSFSKLFILRLIFPIGIMSYVFGINKEITNKQHFTVSTVEFIVTISFIISAIYTPEKIKPFFLFITFTVILYLATKTIFKQKN